MRPLRRCRRVLGALALLASTALPATAEPLRYRIDPAHSFPQFAVSHLGFSLHRGRFNRTSGTVELDRERGSGRIDVSIEAGSVDTGDAALENQLLGANFFDAGTHPTITFRAAALRFADGRPTTADGELTLLGVTRPLTLAIDHFHCGLHPLTRQQVCGANATATLRRSEFGMRKFLSMVGDEVTITLQVEAILETAADSAERPERAGR